MRVQAALPRSRAGMGDTGARAIETSDRYPGAGDATSGPGADEFYAEGSPLSRGPGPPNPWMSARAPVTSIVVEIGL